jgi:hypothetical protein
MALAVVLAKVLLVSCSTPSDGIIFSLGLPSPLSHGHTTFLEPPMDYLEQYNSAASTAPCVFLLLGSHIAESAGNKIEVIIVPPALPPMVLFAAARTKKKREKAAAPAAPAAASNNASTTMPKLSTPPATKKGKTTSKKKATKPIMQHRCGLRQPVAQVITLWQSSTGRSGLSAMPRSSMVTSPTSPSLVTSGTRKGCLARELHQATQTLLTCRGGGCG